METNTLDRRSILKTSGAALGGALAAGCASVAADAGAARSPFKVAAVTLPVVGSTEVFPVRRIYCIGRNYAAHAREMGSDPTCEPPFFSQKPTDAVQFVAVGSVADHPYPSLTKNCHYELELVAALKSGGSNIVIEQALQHVKRAHALASLVPAAGTVRRRCRVRLADGQHVARRQPGRPHYRPHYRPHCGRRGSQPRAQSDGCTPDRRGLERPAHREALVCRPARLRGRPHRGRALVYRPPRHVVNLFVWPLPAAPAAGSVHEEVRQGYNLIAWSQRGMQFSAASDASPEELRQFAGALRARIDAAAPL